MTRSTLSARLDGLRPLSPTAIPVDVTEWLPVRCCCQPTKILGFLEVPKDSNERRSVQAIDRFGRKHTIKIKTMAQVQTDCRDGYSRHQHRALYSEDRPIEFWRTLPSFIESAARPKAKGG